MLKKFAFLSLMVVISLLCVEVPYIAKSVPTITRTYYPLIDGHICLSGAAKFGEEYISASYVSVGECHILMKFELNGIPSGAKIVSAELYLI